MYKSDLWWPNNLIQYKILYKYRLNTISALETFGLSHNPGIRSWLLDRIVFHLGLRTTTSLRKQNWETISSNNHGSTLIVWGGGRSNWPCKAKFCEKCPCVHKNSTALIKLISLYFTQILLGLSIKWRTWPNASCWSWISSSRWIKPGLWNYWICVMVLILYGNSEIGAHVKSNIRFWSV